MTQAPSPRGYEATNVVSTGGDFESVRDELSALFKGSWFKPWMGGIPILILLLCQFGLVAGDKPLERSYDNPWLLFFLFILMTVFMLLVGLRMVYFQMVNAYARIGPEGLRAIGLIGVISPGCIALLVLTMICVVPSVLGFTFCLACANWPGSLIFHVISLSYILCFQLRMKPFTDRMADNVIYLAGLPGTYGIIKVGRRMFSR